MKVSMRSVAKHAGVSVATVSHVINKTRYVSEETIERVQKSIRDLGYVPDPIGRILKTGKKNIIGFIVPDIANPVWSIIIEEVESTIAAYGSKLIIANTKETVSREIDNIQLLASGIVDGLIAATTLPDFGMIERLVPAGFPIVLIDREVANCTCDIVVSEDYKALRKAMEWLIADGHTRIGFITGLSELSTTKQRMSAYIDAMKAADLPVEPEFIQHNGSATDTDLTPFIKNLIDARCTAIVTCNNVLLDGTIRVLKKLNLTVGRDICLLGQGVEGAFEDMYQPAYLFVQPAIEMGRQTGQQIIRRIKHPDDPIRHIVLPTRLLER